MRILTAVTTLIATTLILTPLTGIAQGQGKGPGAQPEDRARVERGQRDIDRDRLRDRDRLTDPARDRDRVQDRTHVPDFAKLSDQDVYGNELMTAEERKQYREQLQGATSSQERAQIEAQHRHEMQIRAQEQGVEIAPPGKGIYGGAMMSVEERNRYREQLRLLESDPEKRTRFMAQHQEEMQVRAKAQGIPVEDLAETEEAE